MKNVVANIIVSSLLPIFKTKLFNVNDGYANYTPIYMP